MKKRNSDSVPAMLTPREAILNRNAAELLGRDAIKRLNDHGNMLAKRGVDLASLPSDPTPGPSTENMLGYQYGTSMVQGDDRADLLRDADSTFYGGGQAPAPTPTPTPTRRYQYGTSSVDDFDPFSTGLSAGGSAMFPTPSSAPVSSMVSRVKFPKKNSADPFGSGIGLGSSSALPFGPSGATASAAVNMAPFRSQTHTEMAADIIKRSLGTTGSQIAGQQRGIPGIDASTLRDQGIDLNQTLQNVNFTTLRNIQDNKDRQAGTYQPPGTDQSTVHFLPPGFTATTGSTGVNGSTPNDIHFLPPGFSSVQGVTNPQSKQLQFQPKQEDLYGSAYGF